MKYRFDTFAINSTKKKKPVESDKYTYLGLENLDSGTLKVTRFGSEVAPIGEKLIMKKGDVLFGKRRAYQKKVAIAPFDGIFSAHGMVLRPNESYINKDFFPLFISSDYFLDNAIKISVGSLSPTINWGDLKKLEFSLPSLEEQEKIAKMLWSINDTIESYADLIIKTEQLSVSTFNDSISSITILENKRLGNILKWLKKSNIAASKGKDEGLFPFFTSGLEHKWIDEYQYDGETIILGNGGTASINYWNGKCATTSHGFAVRSDDEHILTKYVYYYLKNNLDILEDGFRGVGLKNISKEYINDIVIPIPSLGDQKIIIEKTEAILDSKVKLENSMKSLKDLYNGLMNKYIKEED